MSISIDFYFFTDKTRIICIYVKKHILLYLLCVCNFQFHLLKVCLVFCFEKERNACRIIRYPMLKCTAKQKKECVFVRPFLLAFFKARNVIWIYVQITRLLLWWCTMYSFTITLSCCALSWITKRKISHTQKISQNKIEITKKQQKNISVCFLRKILCKYFKLERESINELLSFSFPRSLFPISLRLRFCYSSLFLWSHLFLFFLRKNYCAKYVCTFTFEIPSNHQTS